MTIPGPRHSRGAQLFRECSKLGDAELVKQLKELTGSERTIVSRALVRLFEMKRRDLVQRLGYSSVYIFCVQVLRYPESIAYRRTKVAEACFRFPFLIDLIEDGELNVTTLSLLVPHLNRGNCRRLIGEARCKTTRDVEKIAAKCSPKPVGRERVRIVAAAASSPLPIDSNAAQPTLAFQPAMPEEEAATTQAATEPAVLRIVRTFSCDEELERMITRAKQLLWHKYPSGSFEEIVREALAGLLDRIDPDKKLVRLNGRKNARTASGGQAASRRIPSAVKNLVWKRDGGSCAYISEAGKRCGEKTGLEFDHIKPWAWGGRSDASANIRLLCRSHNQSRAREDFGNGNE